MLRRTDMHAAMAATGSLLAATAAAALVVGGLLGFGAFPGAADERAEAPVRVAPVPAGAHGAAPIVLARAAAQARATPRPERRAAPRSAPAPRRTRAPRRQSAAPGGPALPPSRGGHQRPSTVSTQAQHPPVQSATPPPAPADSNGPLAPAAQAARDTTAAAAAPVEPVAPQAAGPVQAAGAAAADAVEQADRAVAATLNGLGR
jgi:hypothetical protein